LRSHTFVRKMCDWEPCNWDDGKPPMKKRRETSSNTTMKYIQDGESTCDDDRLAALVGLSLCSRSFPKRPRAATRTRINKKNTEKKKGY
jgi:hypothetical protein